MIIYNKCKNTCNDLIDSLDIVFIDQLKSLDWAKSINKGTHNAPRSKNALLSLLENNYLNKNVLVTLLERAPKT